MPLGWSRLNEKRPSPNKNIVFIKPRSGLDESTSREFLERIAAQCLPIMNNHHLAVVSLEEYEPNLEFWGRNFNNGEVIQLVLKSPSTGRWLPFRFVQMVMMHELAHNKQMNHGKAFWKVKDLFTQEMRKLWERGYAGDGLYGRGILLENGELVRQELGDGEILPEHLCGGTFQSRGGKKRKAKPKITYKERQERRIAKKFGTHGTILGADEEVKAKLATTKRSIGKPRVAGSARGRELRAAAALARFGQAKHEETSFKDDDLVTDSDGDEDGSGLGANQEDAVDRNGSKLLDSKGRALVKICEGEDPESDEVKNELSELQGLYSIPEHWGKSSRSSDSSNAITSDQLSKSIKPSTTSVKPVMRTRHQAGKHLTNPVAAAQKPRKDNSTVDSDSTPFENTAQSCPICSGTNTGSALTCMFCAHVLQPEVLDNVWRCSSEACQNIAYLNADDVGICGICGKGKHTLNDEG